MAFENACITAEEYKQYQLASVDKRYEPMRHCSSQWTIDRERNIHMRSVSRTVPPDMGPKDPFWLFFWKTAYAVFDISILEHATKDNLWSGHKALTRLELPHHLQPHKAEIVQDIEAALRVYGTGGVHCRAQDFKLRLDVLV